MVCQKCKAEIPDNAIYCHICGKKQAQEKRKALKRANGTGTVYKRSDRRRKPWAAEKGRILIGYFETKSAALDALEKLSGVTITDRYNMSFGEVFEAWKSEHYKTIGKDGEHSYENAYQIFSPLHERKFRSLRTSDFQAVIDAHSEKSRSSLSKYKQLISQMSKWAMREEIVSRNFAEFVHLPEQKKKEKETFTDDEIKKLEADGSETARIVLMLIYTGMRIGELFSIQVDRCHGRYCIGGEKTEAGRDRVIPIPPKVRMHFEYFLDHATGQLLLSGYTGQKVPANFRKRDYYPMLERLGIRKLNPHCTRHTFASIAVRENMPPEILQKILGHVNYSTTAEVYVHANIDQLVEAVNWQ